METNNGNYSCSLQVCCTNKNIKHAKCPKPLKNHSNMQMNIWLKSAVYGAGHKHFCQNLHKSPHGPSEGKKEGTGCALTWLILCSTRNKRCLLSGTHFSPSPYGKKHVLSLACLWCRTIISSLWQSYWRNRLSLLRTSFKMRSLVNDIRWLRKVSKVKWPNTPPDQVVTRKSFVQSRWVLWEDGICLAWCAMLCILGDHW